MKALTLWQTWASLMAGGFKKIETRSWTTKYRGPVAIHAAKEDPARLPGRFAAHGSIRQTVQLDEPAAL